MLKGKTVLLAVTGSIAAYKTAYLASALHNVVVLCKGRQLFFTLYLLPVVFVSVNG